MRTALRLLPLFRHSRRQPFSTLTSPFRAGDHVVLKPISHAPDWSRLCTLKPLGRVETHKGAIAHTSIIGRLPRDIVESPTGVRFRLSHASLEEYTTKANRQVTPIYAAEANLIVDTLDLHAAPRDGRDEEEHAPPLEIFEAGTGHGALTLHLARAVHVANARLPPPAVTPENIADPSIKPGPRSAIIHTLDRSLQYSLHARRIVRGFRSGLYAGDVDFYTGNITEWTQSQLEKRDGTQFLSAAVLDLPDTAEEMGHVVPALLPDAPLALFCPSITQLVDCLRIIKSADLPLAMDKVLDLSDGAGGRLWDLQLVKPRARDRGQENSLAEPTKEDDWKAICRPKYGGRVTASGFLGVWRRTRPSPPHPRNQ